MQVAPEFWRIVYQRSTFFPSLVFLGATCHRLHCMFLRLLLVLAGIAAAGCGKVTIDLSRSEAAADGADASIPADSQSGESSSASSGNSGEGQSPPDENNPQEMPQSPVGPQPSTFDEGLTPDGSVSGTPPLATDGFALDADVIIYCEREGCPEGLYCDPRRGCVDCTRDEHCALGEFCFEQQCFAWCNRDSDCEPNRQCNRESGRCVECDYDDRHCQEWYPGRVACHNLICVECNGPVHCNDERPFCTRQHVCVECVYGSDCRGNPNGAACDQNTNECVQCVYNTDCAEQRQVCSEQQCVPCDESRPCDFAFECVDGACEPSEFVGDPGFPPQDPQQFPPMGTDPTMPPGGGTADAGAATTVPDASAVSPAGG